MSKLRNELTPLKVEQFLKLGRKYNVQILKKGDLEVHFEKDTMKYPDSSELFKEDKSEKKAVTEEDILMNPYAGLS